MKTFYIYIFLILFSGVFNQEQREEKIIKENDDFTGSLISAFSLIFLSEIGDKTFFLVIIYSFSNSILKTFLVTSIVMAVMTFISVLIGSSIGYFLSRNFICWIAVSLFTIFAIMMFYSAFKKESKLVEEKFKKTVKKLEKEHQNNNEDDYRTIQLLNEPLISENKNPQIVFNSIWPFVFSMVIGELGDNSQIATIIMAASKNFLGVIVGGSLAHACCTLVAILFGQFISKTITNRQIHLIGGVLFTIFAIAYLLEIYNIKFY